MPAAFKKKYGTLIIFAVSLITLIFNIPFAAVSCSIRWKDGSTLLTELATKAYILDATQKHLEEGQTQLEQQYVDFLILNQTMYADPGSYTSEDWNQLNETGYELMTKQSELQTAGTQLQADAIALSQEKEEIEGDLKTIWHLSIASGVVNMSLCMGILCIGVYYRTSTVVRSRGTPFLLHMCFTIFLAIISAMLLAALRLIQFPELLTDPEKLTTVSIIVAYCVVFFSLNCYAAITNRMRIVYNAFNVRSNNFENKHPIFNYWILTPIHFVVFLVSLIPYTIKETTDHLQSPLTSLSYLIIVIVYGIWVGFYTWKCRRGATQYSDLYINFRCILIISITFGTTIICDSIGNNMVGTIGWQYSMQIFSLFYLLDSLTELGTLEWLHVKEMTRRSETSQSRTTRSRHTKSRLNNTKRASRLKSLSVIASDGDQRDLVKACEDVIDSVCLTTVSVDLGLDCGSSATSSTRIWDGQVNKAENEVELLC
eukprot:Pgem_evm1s9522